MKIKSIDIKNIMGGSLKGNYENVRHIKSLPCLSVVQSICGYYEIGLDGETPCAIKEGEAFVAPAGTMQNITHRNGAEGYMEAQWVFMKIIVNDLFNFEDFFDIPLLISAKYQESLFDAIFTIRNNPNMCKKYAAAYELTDILIANSSITNTFFDKQVILLKKYIDEHYSEKITKEDLANIAFCSVSNLYRIFQNSFHLSPHNYINKIRLEKACVLLENSNHSITEISALIGFDDPVYFSKLFKEYHQLSPKKYREISPFANAEKHNE